MIEAMKIADAHNREKLLQKDFSTYRDYLIRKLNEELGEYCEALGVEEGVPRKLAKFGIIDANGIIDTKKWKEVASEKRIEEIVDVFYIVMCLIRLEKVDADELVGRMYGKKQRR